MTVAVTTHAEAAVRQLLEDAYYAGGTQQARALSDAAEMLADASEESTKLPPVRSYAEVLQTAAALRREREVCLAIESWHLPTSYWDTIQAALAPGSLMHRKVCVVAAGQGHVRSIAYAVALNRHLSPRIPRRELRTAEADLSRDTFAVRSVAGAMAPSWTGSLAELHHAALEVVNQGTPGKP